MSVDAGAHGLTATVEDAVTCAVCLDVCIRPCSTSCGHSFCRRCLRSAITHDTQRRCPSCRQPLGRAFADELAINTALWAIIQAMFPQRCEAAPDSPMLTAPPRASRPSQPLSRFAPQSTGSSRRFIPPRRTTTVTRNNENTDASRDTLAASLAALSLSGTPYFSGVELLSTPERHRNSRTLSPEASPLHVIDLTGDGGERDAAAPHRDFTESPAGLPPLSRAPRQRLLQERMRRPRDGGLFVAPKPVVAGLFYTGAPSRQRRGNENQAP